ncbi:MAG: hypothetical protein GY765_39690, partial [bacterium]|nr:hypothetical protein [bacterium]
SIRFVTRDQIVVTAEGKPRENIKFTEYHIHRDYKMFLCATHNRFPSQVNMLPVEQLVEEFVAL